MWLRSIPLAMKASPARYALPLLLGLEVGVVLIEGREWTSEWRWAIDWAGAGVFLAGPLAGGISAWQAQAARRAPGEAAQAVGSRLRIFAFNAGGVFAWAALVHTLVVLLVILYCYRSGLTGWPNPASIVLHGSLLAGCVSIGYIAGQFSVSRLLAPVTTMVLLVVMIQASNGALPTMWVEVAGATAPLAGLRYRPDVTAGQLVLFWGPALVALGVTKGFGRPLVRVVATDFWSGLDGCRGDLACESQPGTVRRRADGGPGSGVLR